MYKGAQIYVEAIYKVGFPQPISGNLQNGLKNLRTDKSDEVDTFYLDI